MKTCSKTREIYHRFVSCVIKGMRKRGEVKIFLSHPRDRKIFLNSTASVREWIGVGEWGKGCCKCVL